MNKQMESLIDAASRIKCKEDGAQEPECTGEYMRIPSTARRSNLPAQSIKLRFQQGFTLIEILVVVSILAILGALVVPKIMDRPNDARVVAAKQDIGAIIAALKLYKLDNGRYPSAEQGLKALMEKPSSEPVPQNWKTGGYLEKAPQDPWGNGYVYLIPGLKGEMEVLSYGADGQAGGEGYDADISSAGL